MNNVCAAYKRALSYILEGVTSKNFSLVPLACLSPLFSCVDSVLSLQFLQFTKFACACALVFARCYVIWVLPLLHCFMTVNLNDVASAIIPIVTVKQLPITHVSLVVGHPCQILPRQHCL